MESLSHIKKLQIKFIILPARYIAVVSLDAIDNVLKFCKDVNFIKFHCMYREKKHLLQSIFFFPPI